MTTDELSPGMPASLLDIVELVRHAPRRPCECSAVDATPREVQRALVTPAVLGAIRTAIAFNRQQ